jgi:hypothetical protein
LHCQPLPCFQRLLAEGPDSLPPAQKYTDERTHVSDLVTRVIAGTLSSLVIISGEKWIDLALYCPFSFSISTPGPPNSNLNNLGIRDIISLPRGVFSLNKDHKCFIRITAPAT